MQWMVTTYNYTPSQLVYSNPQATKLQESFKRVFSVQSSKRKRPPKQAIRSKKKLQNNSQSNHHTKPSPGASTKCVQKSHQTLGNSQESFWRTYKDNSPQQAEPQKSFQNSFNGCKRSHQTPTTTTNSEQIHNKMASKALTSSYQETKDCKELPNS